MGGEMGWKGEGHSKNVFTTLVSNLHYITHIYYPLRNIYFHNTIVYSITLCLPDTLPLNN